MSITVTLTKPRHIKAAESYFAASAPTIPGAPAAYASVQDLVQQTIEKAADAWADATKVDHIAVAAFVRRFPGAAMDAIVASDDPGVVQILATIDSVTHVRLGADTTVNGMAYLVAQGFLTQAQSDAILAY